jgi:hypothetical protein
VPTDTQAVRKRAERDMADTPRRGRRQAVSTTGAACENAVAVCDTILPLSRRHRACAAVW